MKTPILFLLILEAMILHGQKFTRSELPTPLDNPWEMTYGADGNLWVTERNGKVSCVNPVTGTKKTVFTAPDYFDGAASEACPDCFKPKIGSGTFGLALHPDFNNPATSFIYFVHSYNSGTATSPATKFKIRRLKWSASSQTVIGDSSVVGMLPSGYDHLGGRLIAVAHPQGSFLYVSIGDNGISEENEPGCYADQKTNPNNFAQDVNHMNGKIHRFNLDGSIPSVNPVPGNSFFTRGHRNPQGLIYNSAKDRLYDVEHGDRTDDEINLLASGMNYGWKWVRGYHDDDNCTGESGFVSSYTGCATVPNDALKEPLFAWCAMTSDTSKDNSYWGTVAPSDGIYYNSEAIPEWKNSLLVVTLKKGWNTKRQVFRFKLDDDGVKLSPSTVSDPNPQTFFADDQLQNGRLRDIAVSPDGTKIFLINNGGADHDKITVYTLEKPSGVLTQASGNFRMDLFPNPACDQVTVHCSEPIRELQVYNLLGEERRVITSAQGFNVTGLSAGTYYVKVKTESGFTAVKRLLKN